MKKPNMPHLEWHDQHTNTLVRVYCHHCGAIIQGLISDDNPIDTHRINEEIVKVHLAVMSVYPTYQEITVEMHDGSRHVMAVCKQCAQVIAVEHVTEYYKRDVHAFKQESEMIGHEFKSFLADRVPTAIIHRKVQDAK